MAVNAWQNPPSREFEGMRAHESLSPAATKAFARHPAAPWHKPVRLREPQVVKSNGLAAILLEKRYIPQPIARKPDSDAPFPKGRGGCPFNRSNSLHDSEPLMPASSSKHTRRRISTRATSARDSPVTRRGSTSREIDIPGRILLGLNRPNITRNQPDIPWNPLCHQCDRMFSPAPNAPASHRQTPGPIVGAVVLG